MDFLHLIPGWYFSRFAQWDSSPFGEDVFFCSNRSRLNLFAKDTSRQFIADRSPPVGNSPQNGGFTKGILHQRMTLIKA